MRAPVRVAAAAWPIERPASWSGWCEKLARVAAEAAGGGARLLVLPEYAAMELVGLWAGDGEDPATPDEELAVALGFGHDVDKHASALATRLGLHILAGSLPARLPDGTLVNRARLFAPDGGRGVQDKQIPTPWERTAWGIAGGGPLTVFDTALGRLGILVCYDAEFPALGRALAEAGATVLLVPACTDTLAGHHRVRTGCLARALENQCFVVQASTVGTTPFAATIDVNVGAAGIYGPADLGFPADGVIAAGALEVPGLTFADLDPAALSAVRAHGGVRGLADWPASIERAGSVRVEEVG